MLKILLSLFTVFLVSSFGHNTVQYAAIIFRHGDRTPVDTYPTDPWRNQSFWPVKFGELTNLGKKQHYALGKWLRHRYVNLISEDFDPTEVYVRSTDVDRTLMSAQANLAGLYPPTNKSMWNDNLMWQPIPVHTKPEHEDELLAMKRHCDPYIKEKNKYYNSKAFKERLGKYQSLMDYLTAYTGKKVKTYEDISSIYSVLKIESLYNLTLPTWTKTVYPDKLREPACYGFSIATGTSLMARLMIGPLLQQILNNMQAVIANIPDHLKFSIYSGHDFTIGNVLNGLGVFDGNCPEYTSTIFLELVYDNSSMEHFIRVSYRNSSEIVEPIILNLPHCSKLCPVKRFKKLYENILTVNWEKECDIQQPGLMTISIIPLVFVNCIQLIVLMVYFQFNNIVPRVRFWYRRIPVQQAMQEIQEKEIII
ncbi:prostatic acid phosphatase-like [Zerene cesonia]|uniref:prostatic acid phosphatase-like n=1 Tax=Zerene cesonia TaxID=33412 RepID=UPI0018E57E71|nr:prostatic acid phosphatase-like [Zerene cesonia]